MTLVGIKSDAQLRSVQGLSSPNGSDCKPKESGRRGCKPTGSGMHIDAEQHRCEAQV